MSFLAQASFIYLAQFILGLGIAVGLRYYSRIYPRYHLSTWARSAFFFCIHALAYSLLASGFDGPFYFRFSGSLISAICNNLHLTLLLAGTFEAVHARPTPRSIIRWSSVAAIVVAVAVTSSFAYSTERFLEMFYVRMGAVYLLTTISFLIASSWILFSRFTYGIGVKIVATSYALYGLANGYNFYNLIMMVRGTPFTPFPIFGLVELIFIATTGFGLFIWLLEDERERLHKVNQQLDRFIYSTSHDLRAPIASILGLITVARLEKQDPQTLEIFRMIEGRVNKLDHIIADILSLSRVQNTEPKFEMIDFNTLLADSMTDVRFIDGQNRVELRYRQAEESSFLGDYAMTKVVIGNLLSNAVKYHSPSRTDPYIEVLFEKKSNCVVITVTDNGEGILEEHQPRVFDMFYRASTTNAQGTGLGLYIVRETLSRIRGTIRMQSTFGEGTQFVVTLQQ